MRIVSSAHPEQRLCNVIGGCWARGASLVRPISTGAMACLCWRPSPLLAGVAGEILLQECIILRTNGFPPPEGSSGPSDEKERRDDRAETIAIAISLLLIISALAVILGIVLLSGPLRHVPVQWIPGSSALVMLSREANSTTSSLGGSGREPRRPSLTRRPSLARYCVVSFCQEHAPA
jgi:hypothetical protein